jgi:hypothetical protein
MSSLKSYCGPLSELLGMTLDGLYERARSLTHSGYLSGAAGRGPGSGVRATTRNVTKLLLSTLSSDALSEIDEKTRKLAGFKQVDGKCPLTGELRFQNALEKLLSSSELSASVLGISVRREEMGARIAFTTGPDNRRLEYSDFGQRRRLPIDPPLPRPGMGRRITATLEGWTVEMIAMDLQDIAAGVPLRNHTPA